MDWVLVLGIIAIVVILGYIAVSLTWSWTVFVLGVGHINPWPMDKPKHRRLRVIFYSQWTGLSLIIGLIAFAVVKILS